MRRKNKESPQRPHGGDQKVLLPFEQLQVDSVLMMNRLAEMLLEKESLDLKQITEVLGDRPFKVKSNFKAYLEEARKSEDEREIGEEGKASQVDTSL